MPGERPAAKANHRKADWTVTKTILTLCVAAALAGCDRPASPALPSGGQTKETGMKTRTLLVYVGTYTGPKSKGIYVFRLDLATGKTTVPELAGEVAHPSFLAIHPSGRYLYAVSEIDKFAGKKSGAVSAFTISQPSGKLELLNQQPSGGADPCHLTVDRAGRNVLVANYGGGSVEVLPVGESGRLGEPTAFIQHKDPDPGSKRSPNAHSVNLDAAGHFAFVPDLGLDKVFTYRFDPSKGELSPNDPPATSLPNGSGPRHFAFGPQGRFAYVISEKDNTVTTFAYDANAGALKEVQAISTLPEGYKDKSRTAEVQVHPSGKFLYASNRGHDSIAVFAIDAATGKLTARGQTSTGGKWPRHFGIDPTGTYLLAANQRSDSIVIFRIDPESGALTPTGMNVEVPSPSCVKFL